jgi:sulfite reductase (NADPH) flavoprotein alpha-component
MSRGVVSVNQYTGEILGMRTRGQTFLGFVRSLHVRLAGGDAGRNILRWSAAAMLFSLASGLYLWWPVKRVRIRGPWWSRGFWFDVHNSIGIFSLLPLLILAATGTVIGFEDQVASLLDRLSGSSPIHASPSLPRSEPKPGTTQITPDQAVAIACAQLSGTVPYRVQMPRYGGVYVVALIYADNRISAGSNSLSVDPWSGKIISADLATGLSARERFLARNEAIHTGEIFGMPGRVIVALAGVLLPMQALSGLLMWLRRGRVVRTN